MTQELHGAEINQLWQVYCGTHLSPKTGKDWVRLNTPTKVKEEEKTHLCEQCVTVCACVCTVKFGPRYEPNVNNVMIIWKLFPNIKSMAQAQNKCGSSAGYVFFSTNRNPKQVILAPVSLRPPYLPLPSDWPASRSPPRGSQCLRSRFIFSAARLTASWYRALNVMGPGVTDYFAKTQPNKTPLWFPVCPGGQLAVLTGALDSNGLIYLKLWGGLDLESFLWSQLKWFISLLNLLSEQIIPHQRHIQRCGVWQREIALDWLNIAGETLAFGCILTSREFLLAHQNVLFLNWKVLIFYNILNNLVEYMLAE